MSVNTLQRLFYAVHGVTVFEYVRARKLDRARDALERWNQRGRSRLYRRLFQRRQFFDGLQARLRRFAEIIPRIDLTDARFQTRN